MSSLNLDRILGNLVLHSQAGVAGSNGVIFVRDRRAEQGHNAVSHNPVDHAFVVMNRFHHPFENADRESLCASSGSRSAINSIELLISENSTVTCFLSPSSSLFEVKILSARCFGV